MKKTVIKKTILLMTILIVPLLSLSSLAEVGRSGFYLSPAVGFYVFDSNRNLDDEPSASLSLGYQSDSPWAVELVYLRTETETNPFNTEIDLDQYRFDILHHFSPSGSIQPYLALGVGENHFDLSGADVEETLANFGGGLQYWASDALALRADIRLVNSVDHEETDLSFNLGLRFQFGQSSPPPVPRPPVQPAPKPAQPAQPSDSDGDGVVDDRDVCPNTPTGMQVNSLGCEMDSDKDGIPDSKDKCPDSEAGARVDEQGCYIVLKETKEIRLKVNFANNGAEVPQSSMGDIAAVAKFMTEFPLTKVVFEGHTDDRGAAAYNQSLSERRAKAVATALINNFNIDPSRVAAVGYGEERPMVDNDTAANRATNRRVVASISATVENIQK